ncbi:DNA alkylation repair protein [Bacteroidota bacterium]
MKNIIDGIRRDPEKNSDENHKLSSRRFFKEEIKLYGVKAALVHKLGKEYFKNIKQSSKSCYP